MSGIVFTATNSFPATREILTHLNNGEEIFGHITEIRPRDNETIIARIGQRDVLLPALLPLPSTGRIFVLHLDGDFYVREAGA